MALFTAPSRVCSNGSQDGIRHNLTVKGKTTAKTQLDGEKEKDGDETTPTMPPPAKRGRKPLAKPGPKSALKAGPAKDRPLTRRQAALQARRLANPDPVAPATASVAAPKRGRPSKATSGAPAASSAAVPKKRGREDFEDTETPKKRGRPSLAAADSTPTSSTAAPIANLAPPLESFIEAITKIMSDPNNQIRYPVMWRGPSYYESSWTMGNLDEELPANEKQE